VTLSDQSDAIPPGARLISRFGTGGTGALIYRAAPGGPWRWSAWHRAQRVAGECDDRTNAVCAVAHFHGADE
jgi:hypothetical protein